LEHQDLEDNVGALRDELQRLADFLRRTPSPVIVYRTPSPVPLVLEETPRRRIQLTDQAVGGSSVVSSIYPTGPRVIEVVVPEPATSLSRSASNASSLQSYLPSHHSDDDLFEEIDETSLLSPVRWPSEELSVEASTPHITSSSSISSSPLSRSTMSSEATTVMQQAPEFLRSALQGIRDQLRALEDGQAAARNLLDWLHERPEDHAGELAERLQRIEGLIQTLLDQGHPRGPEIYEPPVSRTGSISESTDSRWRSILRDLATPADIETRHMPLPTTARAGPSVARQLDEILSSAHVPSTTPAELSYIFLPSIWSWCTCKKSQPEFDRITGREQFSFTIQLLPQEDFPVNLGGDESHLSLKIFRYTCRLLGLGPVMLRGGFFVIKVQSNHLASTLAQDPTE